MKNKYWKINITFKMRSTDGFMFEVKWSQILPIEIKVGSNYGFLLVAFDIAPY